MKPWYCPREQIQVRLLQAFALSAAPPPYGHKESRISVGAVSALGLVCGFQPRPAYGKLHVICQWGWLSLTIEAALALAFGFVAGNTKLGMYRLLPWLVGIVLGSAALIAAIGGINNVPQFIFGAIVIKTIVTGLLAAIGYGLGHLLRHTGVILPPSLREPDKAPRPGKARWAPRSKRR